MESESLADRARQLIADFEHAAANNAPVTPVMLSEMKALVEDALADKTGAGLQAKHLLEIAREVQTEASDMVAAVGHMTENAGR